MLQRFLDATKDIPMIGIMILKDGKVLDYHFWEPEYRINQYSVSKSFTAMAIGFAIEEGILKLDQPVRSFLKPYWPNVGDVNDDQEEKLEKVSLKHLLTMTVGHQQPHLMSGQRLLLPTEEWARFALSQPLVYEPGDRFVYNNAGPYLAAIVLQDLTGMNMVDYLMPRLFGPLGISRPTWETDPQGRAFGSSGLMLSLSEIARFGQLLLQKGRWEGAQLIPAWWIQEATSPQVATGGGQTYGIGF